MSTVSKSNQKLIESIIRHFWTDLMQNVIEISEMYILSYLFWWTQISM